MENNTELQKKPEPFTLGEVYDHLSMNGHLDDCYLFIVLNGEEIPIGSLGNESKMKGPYLRVRSNAMKGKVLQD